MTVQKARTPPKTENKYFDTRPIDRSIKFLSDMMDTTDNPWAKGVLEADREIVENARMLQPNNSFRNLYGMLRLGVSIRVNLGWEASDPTVQRALNGGLDKISAAFEGVSSYKPSDLPVLAKNLREAAGEIKRVRSDLHSCVEITDNDAARLDGIATGLNSYAAAVDKLHDAVCQKKGVELIHLDLAARDH